jgi:hypothetical protein
MTSKTTFFSTRLGVLLPLLILPLLCLPLRGQTSDTESGPEDVIIELYDQITFGVGESPDWDRVRELFIPQASVTMRMGPQKTATLTLDGWILDFVNFIYNYKVTDTGFEEKIIKMETLEFGDISHVLVLYTAYLPGRTPAPREGIDSFHLIKQDNTWKIVSILNEIPGPQRPKPKVLED